MNIKRKERKNQIDTISIETGFNPMFLEKDFLITNLLKDISKNISDDLPIVFSGGTSLSKAHNIIERFSEDVDLVVYDGKNLNKTDRRAIRHKLQDILKANDEITTIECETSNDGKKETYNVSYDNIYDIPSILRNSLKVEIFFENEPNPLIETKPINSIIDTYIANKDSEFTIPCNSPFNILADKVSAIAWRIYYYSNDKMNFDYTIMRHLYDIHALSKVIKIDYLLQKKILNNFELKDKKRANRGNDLDVSLFEIFKIALDNMKNKSIYKDSYIKFVNTMCYPTSKTDISFEFALNTLEFIYKNNKA